MRQVCPFLADASRLLETLPWPLKFVARVAASATNMTCGDAAVARVPGTEDWLTLWGMPLEWLVAMFVGFCTMCSSLLGPCFVHVGGGGRRRRARTGEVLGGREGGGGSVEQRQLSIPPPTTPIPSPTPLPPPESPAQQEGGRLAREAGGEVGEGGEKRGGVDLKEEDQGSAEKCVRGQWRGMGEGGGERGSVTEGDESRGSPQLTSKGGRCIALYAHTLYSTYTYIYIHVYIYTHTYIYIYVGQLYVYVQCVYEHVNVYNIVLYYVYVCVYIYTHTYSGEHLQAAAGLGSEMM
jgi:hypothetical protein